MKQLTKIGLISCLLFSNAHAVDPVPGFYLGLLGEMSSGPASRQVVFKESGEIFTGRANNSRIGGGGAAMLGFRYQNFRLEAEGLYNWNGTGTVSIEECRLESPTILTPTGYCPQDHFEKNQLGFNGSVAGIYGLVNAYYDFINYNSDTGVFPYIGVGLGTARITARNNFVRTVNQTSDGQSATFSSTAAQGILGVGLFMDDFVWGGIDYRYLTTNTIKDFGNARFGLNTLNFSISLLFDNGPK